MILLWLWEKYWRLIVTLVLAGLTTAFFICSEFCMNWLWLNVSYVSMHLRGHDSSRTVMVLMCIVGELVQLAALWKLLGLPRRLRR